MNGFNYILKTDDVVPLYAIILGIVIILSLIVCMIALYLMNPRKRRHL